MRHNDYETGARTSSIPRPFLSYPRTGQGQARLFITPLKAVTTEFYTVSDGRKRVYTEKDAMEGYGIQRILSSDEVSYTNLFINGILQSRLSYTVETGKLKLKTEDVPEKGTPIILQMITL
ncbi:DUF4183 domain-containing protein [Sporolactobacillus sp. KGMB 08714]|uniref:DUF4183 domain-containing protein n=1 Tax=Sporolactobacillus sp. KGMB 08714 TaxID=3064704 RepID=UPI002FBE9C38